MPLEDSTEMLRSLLKISACRSSIGVSLGRHEVINIVQIPARALRTSSCCCHRNLLQNSQDAHLTGLRLSRRFSSAAVSDGIFSKILSSVGFEGRYKYSKNILRRSGLRLYMCAVELVDYDIFFQELPIEDTFYSWFKITELHMWMCMVRLSSEGKEGVFLRNNMVKNLWEDSQKRMKKLGGVDMQTRRDGLELLAEHLKGSVFSYDEGLMGGDKELAGAVWRSFFDEKCDDPEKIALVVEYIRKQLHHIENVDTNLLMRTGIVTFLPLKGHEDKQRTKHILLEITRRV